jgi:hypothetical protein
MQEHGCAHWRADMVIASIALRIDGDIRESGWLLGLCREALG